MVAVGGPAAAGRSLQMVPKKPTQRSSSRSTNPRAGSVLGHGYSKSVRHCAGVMRGLWKPSKSGAISANISGVAGSTRIMRGRVCQAR